MSRTIHIVFNNAVFATLILTLLGCGASGGTIAGLLPAPKILKGFIKNNIYHEPNDLFIITVPFNSDTYEYNFMEIKERYQSNQAYVSFGPAAINKSIYRVEISLKPDHTPLAIEDIEDSVLKTYIQQLDYGLGTEPEPVTSKSITINGNKARHHIFTHIVPAGLYSSNTQTTLVHNAYLIDYGHAAGLIWVQMEEQPRRDIDSMSPIDFAKSLIVQPNKALQPTAKGGG